MRYRNIFLLAIFACLLLSTMAIMKMLHNPTSAVQSVAPIAAPAAEQPSVTTQTPSGVPEKPVQAEVKTTSETPAPDEAKQAVETAPARQTEHAHRSAAVRRHHAAPQSEADVEKNEAASDVQMEDQQKADVSQEAEKIDMAQVVHTMDTNLRSCRANLWKIEAAKEQWAKDNSKRFGEKPTMEELSVYLKDMPKCPDGGTYDINSLGVEPFCSVHKGRL